MTSHRITSPHTVFFFFFVRRRIEKERDEGLRGVARATLQELEESLYQGLDLVSAEREHPGIKPQADTGNLSTRVMTVMTDAVLVSCHFACLVSL